ncbi:sensor histidine kinase [Cellulomonas sp. SG140]|uniref:sensor histidine kinase n=1 Tax=Cellulomonas sp. SG140 TaxID=2976536 RepID=UPI0021E891EA|nr:HAMP domain-containing sensor histidine kinase [Cellulomonas sp. SG140]
MRTVSPAVRRIRTIRWTTTAVFAATTALCLAVLVVIALRIDTTSRVRSLDAGLRSQASSLAEVIGYADGTFDLSWLDTTRDVRTAPVVGVVTPEEIAYAAPDQSALPADAELRRVLADLGSHPGVTVFVVPGVNGEEAHWAAASLLAASAHGVTTGAIVVVGGPLDGGAEHSRLALGLVVTAAALVVAAALLGHLVSGFAMRPAVRGLAEQERFLLEASHELRTPLTVLGVILDDAAHPGGAPDALVRARRQVDRLATVTSALLLRARASSGAAPVTLEPLHLGQLVEAAVAETGADVRLHTEPTVVSGNPELIAQAVRNLVDNAVRHGAPPIAVTVRDGAVEVTDGGPGIPPRLRRRIRRPGVSRGDGTGTGLAIVEWVARTHGGTLTLDDAPAGGLRARLTFDDGPHRPLMRRRPH